MSLSIPDMNKDQILVVIPARSGSKGLVDKNIKDFNGTPLVVKAVSQALRLFDKEQVYLSTDSESYKDIVFKHTGLDHKYIRPSELSLDSSTNREYVLHLIDYLKEEKHLVFKWVLILQCTSPLRQDFHLEEAMKLLDESVDMIASVNITDKNPYYVQRTINSEGHLKPLFKEKFTRRQDCPEVYELNGVLFYINIASLTAKKIEDFDYVIPYLNEKKYSLDIDDINDFLIAENLERLTL